MRTQQTRSTKYKKKKSEKQRKLILILVLTAMFIGGIYFSDGSFVKFFFALAIEAVCAVSFWMLLFFWVNNGKRKKKQIYKNTRISSTDKKTVERNTIHKGYKSGAVTYESRHNLTKPVEKKYNWTVENEGSKATEKVEEKIQETQSDLKTQVANWSKLVDYSGTVFNRIKEQTYQQSQTVEDELENALEDCQEAEGEEVDFETDEEELYAGYDISDNTVFSDEETEDEEVAYEEFYIQQDEKDDSLAADEYEEQESIEDKEFDVTEELIPSEVAERKKLVLKGLHNSKSKIHVRPKIPSDRIEVKSTEQQTAIKSKQSKPGIKPPMELLKASGAASKVSSSDYSAEYNAKKLIDTLSSFGVGAKITNISKGPSVTRYELQPDYGVKVSKIVNLTDDIALNLAATGVRIEAPIPGKAAVGIEIPNKEVTPVFIRDVIESVEFQNHPSKVAFAVGKDIAGNVVVADIAKMPHLLIAGATGSGKSVCINTLITSILYKASPEEVKLLMIDPKVVELSIYNGIPHLLIPVVTDPKKAAGALNWAVQEMTIRYKLFADNSVRDLKGYNHLMRERGESILPQVVIIIDELADLMMVAANEVEDCICRLAQMARAAGMHLVIATQRPSVDVITGVIKANVPSRVSFAVSSQIDSRTILDMAGAEKLLGRGDMLFNPLGMSKPVRVQGGLITDKEVESIVSFIKSNYECRYDEEVLEKIDKSSEISQIESEDDDELLPQVVNMVIEQGQASTSLIQRKFKLGYSRAARIVDQLESNGIVGPFEGSKPRKVLITKQQWLEMN